MGKARKTKSKSGGRKSGGTNRGYWFRTGRGWYVTEDGKSVPLRDEHGDHIKDKGVGDRVKKACARYLLQLEEAAKQPATGGDMPLTECCRVYLDHSKRHDAKNTYTIRANFLFDFCFGFSGRYRGVKNPPRRERIHPGFGAKPVKDLIPHDVDRWLEAHSGWDGAQPTAVRSLRRALNFCCDRGLIPEKTPPTRPAYGRTGQRSEPCENVTETASGVRHRRT